jgi:MFS family permease
MHIRRLPRQLAARLPFYYGWIVLGCVCCAGFARQASSVAVLSIFVAPMTGEFGWSRAAISGAVSLGGILAAIASPFLGPVLDRRGARAVLGVAILTTAASAMGLSLVSSLWLFYALFCIGRMNFAGPFDLGIYGALASWFVARRAQAVSIATLAQMSGLVILPLVAQLAMARGGWRTGWLVVGLTVGAVGFLPVWLLLVRRPEDLDLSPDPAPAPTGSPEPAIPEPVFSRAQALSTRAFWLLSLYGLLIWPVQAGVSLHQAPNLIERGIGATTAATVISAFSAMSALAGFGVGFAGRRVPLGLRLAVAAALMSAGALAMTGSQGRSSHTFRRPCSGSASAPCSPCCRWRGPTCSAGAALAPSAASRWPSRFWPRPRGRCFRACCATGPAAMTCRSRASPPSRRWLPWPPCSRVLRRRREVDARAAPGVDGPPAVDVGAARGVDDPPSVAAGAARALTIERFRIR